jgi:hypothetical protein
MTPETISSQSSFYYVQWQDILLSRPIYESLMLRVLHPVLSLT